MGGGLQAGAGGSDFQYVRREEAGGDISQPPGDCLTFFGLGSSEISPRTRADSVVFKATISLKIIISPPD